MKLFCLYSFSPPDLNSRIKSRLSVRPSSKYNRPVHSVTCTCQKCGMSQKQRAQRRVKESQRDVKRTDWDEGKRYANMRMTSSLREEKKEGWEWGEARAKSRMKQKWAEMENHSFVKQKKKTELHYLFRKDNITLRDWQSPFNQITNCNKLPAGRHHHKSKPAALLGNWLQIFHCCFAKSRSFSGQSPLKRPCPQILELQKFPNT